jgi:DnaK suppressor protein
MESLSSNDILKFQRQLEQQLSALLTRAGETADSLSKQQYAADPLDRASEHSLRESDLRFRERENRLIHKIKTALLKIDEGTFGICESCGDDIPSSRLYARPVTGHCIKCKTEMEKWENMVS